jgi:hypothetical protein
MIVALARKLLIALWRFVTTGDTLEGVILRSHERSSGGGIADELPAVTVRASLIIPQAPNWPKRSLVLAPKL